MAVDPNAEYVNDTPVGEIQQNMLPDRGAGEKQPEVGEARKNNVKRILAEVKSAKKHWAGDFKRMRDDVHFAQGHHWDDAMLGLEDDRLIVDITTRHLQLRTAALYAKNPTVVARRRETMDFLVWDETPQSAIQAQAVLQAVQQAAPGVDPSMAAMSGALPPDVAAQVGEAAVLLDDIAQGMSRRAAYDKLGRTLQIVFKHQVDQQNPPFKGQIKAMVPRALTTNVGWIKLDYQRETGRKPGQENRLADMRDRLAEFERRLRDWNDDEEGSYDETRAEYDELQTQAEQFAAENQPIVLKEGLLFQFPASWAIIPDKKCRNLTGFVGSDWVAEEMEMSPEDIKETYKVDLGQNYTKYNKQYDGQLVEARNVGENETCHAAVYTVYNRRTGLVYVVCDGYDDFLKAPAPPEVKFSHFFPWFALTFNRTESARSPYAKSDVRLIKPIQCELNRTAEALRQHRIANQPKYMHDASAFEEDEALNVQNTPPHESIPVKLLAEGRKLKDDVIQPIPKEPIDPNVYSTEVIYDALTRVIGTREPRQQPGNRTSATEASIDEAARMSSEQSNADDLDDLLNLVARNAGEVLLTLMQEETAKKIAGPGGIWTQLSPEEAADRLYLECEAGSSGRPNQAQEMAVMEKGLPLAMQIPGLSPIKMLEELLKVMSARWKVSDMIDPTITQSIISMNRGGGAGIGPVTNDPNQQGPEGAQNAPNDNSRTQEQGPGSQTTPLAA